MTVNDEQITFLDYFCDDRNSFDYAILIDAPWGSGKTYFLRQYLNRRFAKTTDQPSDGPDYLWVSFFGRTSAAEVRDALFAQAHPWLSSKWGALAGSVGSSVLKKVSGIDVGEMGLAKQFLPEIRAKLIVFDDLERTSIGPGNALGLINGFIEGGNFKVIVIANQKPIADDDEYRSQKEKVIGRTVTVMSDPDAVLNELTKNLKDSRARDSVITNRDSLLTVFRGSGYHNLRSLRASLDDFDRLVSKCDSSLGAAPAALRELLLYLLAVGMEVRADAIPAEKLERFLASATRLSFAKQSDPQIQELRNLTTKYPGVKWQNPVVSPGVIGGLIAGGLLPLAEINDGLKVHSLVVGPAQVPAWLAIWNWTQLNATDYLAARAGLLDQISKYAIVHPGEILHVVGVSIWLEEFGDPLTLNVVVDFSAYIDVITASRTLIGDITVFDIVNSDGWANLGYQKSDDPRFAKVRAHLQRAVEAVHTVKIECEAILLLERLKMGGNERDLFEFDRKVGQFGGVPILHNIRIADMADVLLDDSLFNSTLMAALHRRYELSRGYPEMLSEKTWLTDVENEIRKRAAAAQPPFAELLIRRIDYWFGPMQDNLSKIGADLVAQPGRSDLNTI